MLTLCITQDSVVLSDFPRSIGRMCSIFFWHCTILFDCSIPF